MELVERKYDFHLMSDFRRESFFGIKKFLYTMNYKLLDEKEMAYPLTTPDLTADEAERLEAELREGKELTAKQIKRLSGFKKAYIALWPKEDSIPTRAGK